MSVPTITYENFEGDPFIDSISTTMQLKALMKY